VSKQKRSGQKRNMRASNIETVLPNERGIDFWVRTSGDSKNVSLNKHQLKLREYALKVMAGLKYIVLTKLVRITTFRRLNRGPFIFATYWVELQKTTKQRSSTHIY
jgi:hypothetical protein